MDKLLASKVSRVRFTGEYYLNRMKAVGNNLFESLYVLENQARTFIFGKTTTKTNGQGFRIEQGTHCHHLFRHELVFRPAVLHPLHYSSHKLML